VVVIAAAGVVVVVIEVEVVMLGMARLHVAVADIEVEVMRKVRSRSHVGRCSNWIGSPRNTRNVRDFCYDVDSKAAQQMFGDLPSQRRPLLGP